MNIWIFNHHAQGPSLPGGTRHYDLAKQLIERGHSINIFAAGYHYTLLKETVSYDGKTYKSENIEGVDFVWVKTYPYKVNNLKRMINIVSYAWKLNFLIPNLKLAKPDIIIGTTVHPFAPLVAYRFAKKYKIPFVFEIRDLWPQSFIDMGIWEQKNIVSKIFKLIEKYTVFKADRIIALSPKTEQYIKDEYEYTKITYIPNSIDLNATNNYAKISCRGNDTIQKLYELKDKNKFICMFTGAIVKTNTIGVFVDAASKLLDTNIVIVLVGDGQEKSIYEKVASERKLNNIFFLEPVRKDMVPSLLSLSDLLLLVQGNILWGSSNKLFDYLAARKPIVTSLYAKHNDIVEKVGCGFAADYGISDDMVNKILNIYGVSNEERKQMGDRAYAYVSENHTISLMADKLENLCQKLTTND